MGTIISKDTVTNVLSAFIYGLVVENQSYYSLWQLFNINISSELVVTPGSSFYVTSDEISALLVSISGTTQNLGIISFDSREAFDAPNYQVTGDSFQNFGSVFFSANGTSGVPIMEISTTLLQNIGFLTFYQAEKTSSVVLLGVEEIDNGGDICFWNQIYSQQTEIIGTGCIHLQQDTTVILFEPLLEISPDQIFHLDGPFAQLLVSTKPYDHTILVTGFGGGNFIGVDGSIASYYYYEDIGELMLSTTETDHLLFIQIGTGYVGNFLITSKIVPGNSVPESNVITFEGEVPNPINRNCRPCPPIPIAPMLEEPSSSVTESSYSTSTESLVSSTQESIIVSTSDVQSSSQAESLSSIIQESSSALSSSIELFISTTESAQSTTQESSSTTQESPPLSSTTDQSISSLEILSSSIQESSGFSSTTVDQSISSLEVSSSQESIASSSAEQSSTTESSFSMTQESDVVSYSSVSELLSVSESLSTLESLSVESSKTEFLSIGSSTIQETSDESSTTQETSFTESSNIETSSTESSIIQETSFTESSNIETSFTESSNIQETSLTDESTTNSQIVSDLPTSVFSSSSIKPLIIPSFSGYQNSSTIIETSSSDSEISASIDPTSITTSDTFSDDISSESNISSWEPTGIDTDSYIESTGIDTDSYTESTGTDSYTESTGINTDTGTDTDSYTESTGIDTDSYTESTGIYTDSYTVSTGIDTDSYTGFPTDVSFSDDFYTSFSTDIEVSTNMPSDKISSMVLIITTKTGTHCPVCTTYTTPVSSINSAGETVTKTYIIVVTTDGSGKTITVSEECLTYTEPVTRTDDKGRTITEEGNTTADQSLTTITKVQSVNTKTDVIKPFITQANGGYVISVGMSILICLIANIFSL